MNKQNFRRAFLRGLGTAIIHLKNNDHPEQFRDIVLYGCLHNTTYDMQCEGDRGWYLYQAAQLVGDARGIEAEVIQHFFKYTIDNWLFNQWTSILCQFARNGSEAAFSALYHQYETMLQELSTTKPRRNGTYPRRDMFDWLCVWLTSVNGWNAFKRIVTDVSEYLLPKGNERFFSEWFYDHAKLEFGTKRVDNYLRKQAAKSPYIRSYCEQAIACDNRIVSALPNTTFEEVIAAVRERNCNRRGIIMDFIKKSSSKEIEKLALAAIHEPNEDMKMELLWPFKRFVHYCFPEDFLLSLCASSHEGLKDTAFDIMGRNPSENTRKVAITCIQSGDDIENGICLLAKNLHPKDETLLYSALKLMPIRHNLSAWHTAFMWAGKGIDQMRGKPKTDILEYMYRNTLCGCCRERIVVLMHRKKVLSETVLQECQYDSNGDIRAFVKRVNRRNNHFSGDRFMKE